MPATAAKRTTRATKRIRSSAALTPLPIVETNAPAAAVVEAAPATPGKTGKLALLKRTIFENPTLKIDELVAKMAEQGHSVSKVTCTTVVSDFRHTMRILADIGVVEDWPPLPN